jgi:hypothetical protein
VQSYFLLVVVPRLVTRHDKLQQILVYTVLPSLTIALALALALALVLVLVSVLVLVLVPCVRVCVCVEVLTIHIYEHTHLNTYIHKHAHTREVLYLAWINQGPKSCFRLFAVIRTCVWGVCSDTVQHTSTH